MKSLLTLLAIAFTTTVAYTHPGKTDANGWHTDSKTGQWVSLKINRRICDLVFDSLADSAIISLSEKHEPNNNMHSQHTNHPSFRANLSWEDVETAADESPAVKSISNQGDHYEIYWVDGSKDKYTDPQEARIAIKEME